VSYVVDHWSYDPFLIVALILACWYEVGMRRLARRSRPARTRQRRLRSIWFYGGLTVLLLTVQSPIDYWAGDYFFVHVIQHLLLMFAAPTLIVAGAPWQPLLDALPGRLGRSATREVLRGSWSRPLRAAGSALLMPWVSVALFSIVMVLWHVPRLFDLAENNLTVHIWLMHSSFFLAGVLFWLQFIASPPFRIRMSPAGQAVAMTGTSLVMVSMAISMSIFSQSSWYPVYDHIPGVTLPPLADQRIGAVILWVGCELWCLPCAVAAVRQLLALRRRRGGDPAGRPAAAGFVRR
jgi:cytochrome c oxidase assembly factor CtaG